jgi:hypothetical protein
MSTPHVIVHVHAACSSPCSIDMEMEHGLGHAARIWTHSLDMDINMGKHMLLVHVLVQAAYPCP